MNSSLQIDVNENALVPFLVRSLLSRTPIAGCSLTHLKNTDQWNILEVGYSHDEAGSDEAFLTFLNYRNIERLIISDDLVQYMRDLVVDGPMAPFKFQ